MNVKFSTGIIHFKDKAIETLGVKEWDGKEEGELLFFGLFFPEDFEAVKNFKGDKSIFWCGSDILRTLQNKDYQEIVKESGIKHYCETEVEASNLTKMGIGAKIIPSFLGNINNFPVSFQVPLEGDNWKIWLCGHSGREGEYGFYEAIELTKIFPDIEIHLYGVDGISTERVIYHGLISEKKLDKDIRQYHCGFRANFHDGVSEVVLKSIFLGQYPISRLPYEGVWQYNNWDELVQLINKLKHQTEPNLETREIWLKKINNFPFCEKT